MTPPTHRKPGGTAFKAVPKGTRTPKANCVRVQSTAIPCPPPCPTASSQRSRSSRLSRQNLSASQPFLPFLPFCSKLSLYPTPPLSASVPPCETPPPSRSSCPSWFNLPSAPKYPYSSISKKNHGYPCWTTDEFRESPANVFAVPRMKTRMFKSNG